MMVQAQEEMGEGSANPTDPHHTPTIIQPSTSQPQKKQKPRKPKRKDTEVPQPSGPTDNVADEAVYEEMDDSLERAATTATSLDAEQDRGNINKTQSKATPNEPSSLGTSSGGGPRCQETMGDTITQTRFENVSKTSNDSLLAGVNTPRSDEDSLKLKELMELSRIESSEDEGLGEEDASKQGWIDDIDVNEDIYLVNIHRDEDMFEVNDLEVTRAQEKRNRPPTKAQQRSIMCTYLKNMAGYKHNQLKNKKTELVEESSKKAEAEIAHESSLKRAGEELEQEGSKKHKLEEDNETEELKQCLEIIPDDRDNVTIDAIPLSTKSPTIGRIIGIKSLLEVTATHVRVTAAKQNLVLFSNLNEKYAKFANAGIMAPPFSLSEDNIELQFGTNHIDHFHLTNILLETMNNTTKSSWRFANTTVDAAIKVQRATAQPKEEDEKSGSEDNHNEDDRVTEVENVNENENKTDGNDHSVTEENRKGDDLSARKKFRKSNSAQNESKQSKSNKRTENTLSTNTAANSESNSTETQSKEQQQISCSKMAKKYK
ncbi:uncharacterized mitochondrial protein-like protein [Tanacetum coccineum]